MTHYVLRAIRLRSTSMRRPLPHPQKSAPLARNDVGRVPLGPVVLRGGRLAATPRERLTFTLADRYKGIEDTFVQ
jgi:hypothetical protein